MTRCLGSREYPTVTYAYNRGAVVIDPSRAYGGYILETAGRSYFIEFEGECPSCGHNYSLNQDQRLRRHQADGCSPGLYRLGCIRRQRPERLYYADTTKRGAVVLDHFLVAAPEP